MDPGPTTGYGSMSTVLHYLDVRHWHGCQDPLIELLDERVAKALSHRVRRQILERLHDHGEASPSVLADALGEPLGNVSYHMRVLRELDCVALVRTEPRRGALKHVYRATLSPWIDDEPWAQLPAAFRRTTLSRTLAEILDTTAQADPQGGFDGPETHVSRVALMLDEQGLTEIATLLAKTLDTARRINAESADRRAQRDAAAPPPIATELALMHLRRGDAG